MLTRKIMWPAKSQKISHIKYFQTKINRETNLIGVFWNCIVKLKKKNFLLGIKQSDPLIKKNIKNKKQRGHNCKDLLHI